MPETCQDIGVGKNEGWREMELEPVDQIINILPKTKKIYGVMPKYLDQVADILKIAKSLN